MAGIKIARPNPGAPRAPLAARGPVGVARPSPWRPKWWGCHLWICAEARHTSPRSRAERLCSARSVASNRNIFFFRENIWCEVAQCFCERGSSSFLWTLRETVLVSRGSWWYRRLARSHPVDNTGWVLVVEGLRGRVVGRAGKGWTGLRCSFYMFCIFLDEVEKLLRFGENWKFDFTCLEFWELDFGNGTVWLEIEVFCIEGFYFNCV